MEDSSPFLNSEKFFKIVEDIVWELDVTYIEATILACDKLQIDPEDITKLKLINMSLKDRIKNNAMDEGYLKKEAQLPI